MTGYTPTQKWLLRRFGRSVVIGILRFVAVAAFLGFLVTSAGSALVELTGTENRMLLTPMHTLELAVAFAWLAGGTYLLCIWLLTGGSR